MEGSSETNSPPPPRPRPHPRGILSRPRAIILEFPITLKSAGRTYQSTFRIAGPGGNANVSDESGGSERPGESSTTLAIQESNVATEGSPEENPEEVEEAGKSSAAPDIQEPNTNTMFNTNTMNEMLTLNVDKHVSHFAIFTTHGTLLSHDNYISVPVTRSFAALVGRVWRNRAAALANNTNPDSTSDIQKVVTLKLIHKRNDKKQLKALVIVWEGIVAVVQEVRPRVLLAAQKDLKDIIPAEEGKLSEKLEGLKLSATDEGNDPEKTNGGEKKADAADGKHANESSDDGAGDGGAGEAPEGEGDEAGDAKAEDAEPDYGQIQVMTWRVDVMVEAIREEWTGELPPDFS